MAIDLVGSTPPADGTEPDSDMMVVTSLPTDGGGVFAVGSSQSDAAQPWIAAAAEGTSGSVVVWLKLIVDEGVTAMQAVPIWARWNPPSEASTPADAASLAAVIDGVVFGGPGAALGATPLAFADLAGFTPPLEAGTQEYFVVARSTSDFALAALSMALVMSGLTDDAASDTADESPTSTAATPTSAEPDPEPLAWLARLRSERPFTTGGDPATAFPAAADGPTWLVDVQAGDAGALALWVTETMTAGGITVRALPVWLKLNPQDASDPLVAWTGDAPPAGSSTTLIYPGDAAADAPPLSSEDFAAAPIPEGGSRTSLQVLRSESNVELALTTVLVLLVQSPDWVMQELNGDGVVPPIVPSSGMLLGTGGVLSALSAWLSQASLPAPEVGLARDTGRSPTDRITSDARLDVDTLPGLRAEYSSDDGRTWRRGYRPRAGANTVLVRQVARGGLTSPATMFQFTLDQRPPPSPQVALAAGRSGERQVLTTAEGRLVAVGIEPDARLQYSVNGGPWRPSPALGDRFASLRVRQVDVAGNASRPSAAVPLWRILAAGVWQQSATASYSLKPRTRRA